jgi:hypothetical protein
MDRMDIQSGTPSRGRAGAPLSSWHFPLLAVLGASILAACTSKSKNPAGPNPAAALQLATAPPSSFASRATISPAPMVQLVDASGDPVSTSGTAVTATLTAGTGALGGATVVSTNTGGQAVFSNLSIAGTVGTKAITFSSPGLTSAPANGLSLTAGAPANATASSSLSQSALTGSAVAQLPSITVTDADGNPVAGLNVTFAITAGGGSLTGGGQTTNASGAATVTSWTTGGSAGTNTMTATATGLSVVTFNVITAPAGVAVELKVQTAPPATVAARATLTPAPVIQLVDVTGAAVNTSGVSVTVALTGGGTLNGSASANTDAAGQATFTGLSIAGLVGARRLQFSSTNLVGVQSGTITLTPGPATTIAANSVVTQNGITGAAVAALPEVKVTDADGNGVSGVGVLFTLTGGGGTIGGASQTTNASGVATLGSWSLGGVAGANTVNASGNGVSLTGAPITFTVNATAPASSYAITLQFLTSATAAQQAAFANAKARWETVITGDIPDIDVTGAPACDGVTSTGVVDDVRILVELDSIDGPGKILGSAGPCIIRLTSRLTAIGVMRFDTADVRTLELNGSLNDVILHEMGHVLGYGTLWDQPQFNFLNGSCTAAPSYTGPNAVAAFVGSNGGAGTSIPVENFPGSPPSCPNGTRDSHWEEDVFRSEVMTGFISGTFRPLSLTSIQSLKDLGYVTNPAAADAFNLSTQPTVRALAADVVLADLSNDVLNIPIYAIDQAGRVTLFRDRR